MLIIFLHMNFRFGLSASFKIMLGFGLGLLCDYMNLEIGRITFSITERCVKYSARIFNFATV